MTSATATRPAAGREVLARRIRMARAATGLGIKEFAEGAGISRNYITALEDATAKDPTQSKLRAIAEFAADALRDEISNPIEWIVAEAPPLPPGPRPRQAGVAQTNVVPFRKHRAVRPMQPVSIPA